MSESLSERIRELVNCDMSVKQIATELGVSRQTIYLNYPTDMHLPSQEKQQAEKTFLLAEAIKHRSNLMTYAKIAAEMNLGVTTVTRMLYPYRDKIEFSVEARNFIASIVSNSPTKKIQANAVAKKYGLWTQGVNKLLREFYNE